MKTLLKKTRSANYNVISLITHITGGGANSSALNKLKHFLAFTALTLSLNVTSAGDVNQFNKQAYLNLNQEYTQNHQVATKEEDAVTAFFMEVFSSIRSALGGTDSDNTDQLGNKITNSLENKATNKVDNLINTKINELVNSVGNGKTEISVHQLESSDPTYSIKTIQPLTELNGGSTELTFIQAQLNSGENHGERRDTINLGIGQRYLLEGGQSIAGINLFTDYETESKHKRASLGLEYQRANFSANVNKYYPLSDKVIIGDYTEEPLAGHDIKLSGQAPYLPWAKIKGTHYYWDKTDAIGSQNIKGAILGVEIELNPSTTLEIGTENSNTAQRSSYARLSAQFPFKKGEALTNFKVADQAFVNSNIVTLTNLDYVERSNKIRIEKLLNGVSVVLGEYNAPTVGSTCTLYNALGVAIANGSGTTGTDGSVALSNVVLSAGLVTMACSGGTYTDEATGQVVTNAPTLRAGVIYSGTGDLVLLVSPLSEIAYQLAIGDLAGTIASKNTDTATAFGLNGVDFTTTIPTDLNNTPAANDDAGKFGTVLAAISQMAENSAADGGQTPSSAEVDTLIAALVTDMADGDIDGINDVSGNKLNLNQAINNFKTGSGDNNPASDSGSNNADNAVIETTTPSVILNTTTATLGEAGTATYTVVLNTQPTGSVTITPASSDEGAATVSGAMTFTTTDWNTPQTVTITGVADDDTIDESVIISHTIAGGDYDSVTSANVGATVTDDGIGPSVPIGTQTWSASNVSLVPTANNILDTDYWHAYVDTNGSGDATDEDGYYYTWDAAMNVCPSGWRLPSDDDWKDLEGHLGMSDVQQDATGWRGTSEGTELKKVKVDGFNAKLAGLRDPNESFYNRGEYTTLWSSSTESGGSPFRRSLSASYATVERDTSDKVFGFSVRCLKD